MRYLFITDPLPDLKIYKDSSYIMMKEAYQRGHTVLVAQLNSLKANEGKIQADVQRLHFIASHNTESIWYELGTIQTVTLNTVDAIIMRKDPPINMQYIYAAQLLMQAEHQGARVLNSAKALITYNEKLSILHFPQYITATIVTQCYTSIQDFIYTHNDVIAKPLNAMGGAGIVRLRAHDPNINAIVEMLTYNQTQPIMVQRYIPEIKAGDKRILVINGEPVPWGLARTPRAGENRANLACGGQALAYPLSAQDQLIGKQVGAWLKEQQILLAGLDVIGPFLTEINITSPTCLQEIMNQSPINVASLFIDAVEQVCH